MNLKNYPRRKYEIDQFTQPHCSELEGQYFHFVMDDGRDFDLNFKGKDTVLWNFTGEVPRQVKYQCLKGDDTTYMVDYELDEVLNTLNRVNHLFIIDLEQRLVTRLICTIGDNPKFPYLVKSVYTFGAIDIEGMELPFKRHTFTTEMLGTRVEWHWNTMMITRHCYYSTAFYRITYPGAHTLINRDTNIMNMAMPASDEPAQYVKIKNKLYLFTLTEEYSERAFSDRNPPFRCNNMSFLQNYDRMYHVGRTFGNILDAATNEVVPCHIQFGAFGNPVVLSDTFLNADNPFTI